MFSVKLYIGIIISTSSILSTNKLLIFEMHNLNGALLLNARHLFVRLLTSVPSTVILSFTTTNASLSSHESYRSTGVLKLIPFLIEYCPFDKLFISIHFLFTHFGTIEYFSKIFCSVSFYNTCFNSFKITSLFAGGMTTSSTFL